MVPMEVLLEHIRAIMTVWAVVLVAGVAFAKLCRVPMGFPGQVLLGLAYWAVPLYLFPFDGGLDAAMLVAIVAFVFGMWRDQRWVWGSYFQRKRIWAGVILAVGCAVYASIVLWNFVPLGRDGGMVMTSTRLIAEHAGLPRNYAPWFEGLYFPAVNLALPTVGGVAVRLGSTPASAVLGLTHLAYSSWILSTYLLLRMWSGRTTAATLAVSQAWASRWAQNTLGWGGFPTVAGMAMGVFAVPLMRWALRRGGAGAMLALGVTIAAIPLVHGISAAVWIYAVGPVAVVSLLVQVRHRWQALRTLAGAGVIGVVLLGCYLLAGQVHMSEAERHWAHDHVRGDSPASTTLKELVPETLTYLRKYGAKSLTWIGMAGWVCLLVFGRWRLALTLAGVLVLLSLVVMNVQSWILPFSDLLYPNRTVYWTAPLAAAAAAAGWKTWNVRLRLQPRLKTWAALGLGGAALALTFNEHLHQYQTEACSPVVGRQDWEFLRWAGHQLNSREVFVRAHPSGTGTFLPGYAGVASDAWQVNHSASDEWRAIREVRHATHELWVEKMDAGPPPRGEIVYQRPGLVVVQLQSTR